MTVFEKIFNLDNLIRLGLAIGIIISLTVFIQISAKEFFPDPNRDDFCPNFQKLDLADSRESCEILDGNWKENTYIQDNNPQTIQKSGFCSEKIECQIAYDEKFNQQKSARFVVAFTLSLLVFIIGVYIKIKPVNLSLIWTGVISLLFSLGQLPNDNRIVIVMTSLVSTIVLIILLYRKKINNE